MTPLDQKTQREIAASDMPAGGWVDRRLARPLRPYARLMRLDRPIGTWLLLFPGWWTITLATGGVFGDLERWTVLMALFAVGSALMRGAGCTINDILDRDIDAKVGRTAERPIPSGAVSPRRATAFLGLQLLAALAILIQLPETAVWLGVAAAPLIGLYPLMKRITWWPQVWLGLTFNWPALVGWAAATGALAWPAAAIYAGGVFWTFGYDTIYAHQDREDDRLIGVKSSALALGAMTRPVVGGVYLIAAALFAAGGWMAKAGPGFYVFLALAALHLQWQAWSVRIDEAARCLETFDSNRAVGWLLLAGCLLAGAPLP